MKIGEVIAERYQIIRHLGSGGMANVYLAKDLILEREVAIKFLRLDLDNETDAAKRFEREAKSITEFNHPNIVSVYDVSIGDEGNFIVMEYVPGGDLKQYIRENHPLSASEYQNIMLQILAGVECAHHHQIIHRDLKPQNIRVTPDGQVKIMDFGIAVVSTQTSITQTSAIIGSVHYLSPEQARGGFASPQSDIYSLGIVSYEMLTGHVPFDGDSPVGIALKHFQEPLPLINQARSDVPNAIQNIIYKATAKDKAARYISCQEMADDLYTALTPERVNEALIVNPLGAKETMLINQPILSENWQEDDEAMQSDYFSPLLTDEFEEPMSFKAKPSKRRLWLWIFMLLLGISAISFGVIWLFFNSNDIGGIPVPDIAGKEEAVAIQILREANLQVGDIKQEPSEDIEEGLVTRTVPSKNTRVAKNSVVSLFISNGQKAIEMKDYTDMPYEEAKKELEALGFKVNKKEDFSAQIAEGNVIGQSISAMQQVKPSETTVTLTVSKGPEAFTMEDLKNWTQSEVQAYASKTRINVTFNEEFSSSIEAGHVISQSIAAGATFYEGSVLQVVLSKGEETDRFNYTITIPYSNGEDDAREENDAIEIYIEDLNHDYSKVADSFTIDADFKYKFHFETKPGETARFKIVRNGRTIAETKVKASE